MLRLIGALLVGILSASFAVIFQNDVAAFFGRAPITVQATVGAWAPHPKIEGGKIEFSKDDEADAQSFSINEELNFVRLVIKNNTGKTIESAFVRVDDSETSYLWAYDALVIRKIGDTIERKAVTDAKDNIEVGSLPAARQTVVYIWSSRGFGYPYSASDIQVLTSDGLTSKTITLIRASSANLFFGISTETIAWVIVFFLVGISALLIYLAAHGSSFVKSLFLDEDYYLNERVKFESDPEKYAIPDALPKNNLA